MYPTRWLPTLALLFSLAATAFGQQADADLDSLVKALNDDNVQTRLQAIFELEQLGPKAIPGLLEALKNSDPRVRSEALVALSMLGPNANEAVPQLAKNLRSDDAQLREMSMLALGGIGPPAASAVEPLEKLLDGEDNHLAVDASLALLHIKPDDPEIRSRILKAALTGLRSSNPHTINESIFALSLLGSDAESAIPQLVEEISSAMSPERVAKAAAALGSIGVNSQAVTNALVKAFASDNPQVQGNALQALVRVRPATDPQVETLAKLLGGENETYRGMAFQGLLGLAGTSTTALDALLRFFPKATPEMTAAALDALDDTGTRMVPAFVKALGDEATRGAALKALSHLGPDAAGAVPALEGLLASPDSATKLQTLLVLAHIRSGAAPATDKIAALLDDADPQIAQAAAYALGKIGPGAKAAVPLLTAKLSSQETFLPIASAWALTNIVPDDSAVVERALPLLAKGFEEKRPQVIFEFAESVDHLGPKALPLLPTLLSVAKDGTREPVVRATAIYAIGAIGPDAKEESLGFLLKQLEAKDASVRLAAIYALANVDPQHGRRLTQLVPILLSVLEERDDVAHVQAIEALSELAEHEPEVVTELAKALQDADVHERASILAALAELGEQSQPALPAIREMLKDDRAPVRYNAGFAVGKIGPSAKEAVPDLKAGLSHPDPFQQITNAYALARVVPDDPIIAQQVLPLLERGLTTGDARVRLAIIDVLAELGPRAAPAKAAVEAATNDREPAIRRRAQRALKKLEASGTSS
ncbi:HEAT repeat protein [Planctomycetes bacterium Pan216]|uniref:HEAT repeat protein n=1 Tax=Kolteria novifilia TaxID=2527975 RepID=A0A518AYG0_9BACT|nr:HEAT repeat protein [Planctomycetes bacterium Pan216]